MNRKVCSSEVKEVSKKDLVITHFISSELPDRGGDILYAGKNKKGDGMIMLGKPVVLQQHGWGQMGMEPIAKPLSIKVSKFKDRNGIEAKTQFFNDETGRRLFEKASTGFMPNWSVGWLPMDGKVEVKTDESGRELRHVYEWELLEYSLVAVPMQPDAQTAALAFKIMNDRKLGKSATVIVHRELQRNKDGKLVVNVDEHLVKRIVGETVKKAINSLRGKVE